MTLDVFLRLLQTHLAALQSNAWPEPHDAANGPAFFLDADETRELLAELTRMKTELAAARDVTARVAATPQSTTRPATARHDD